MRNVIGAILCLIFFCFPLTIHAGSVIGMGTTNGKFGSVILHIETEWIAKREMDTTKMERTQVLYGVGGWTSYSSDGGSFDLDSRRVYLNTTIGLHPYVDITFKLGATDSCLELDEASALSLSNPEIDSEMGLSWGLGVKVRLFEINGFRLISTAQFLSYKTDSTTLFANGKELSASRDRTSELEAKEWKFNLSVNKSYGSFVPYLGVNYSDSEIDYEWNSYIYDGSGGIAYTSKYVMEFEQKNNWGFFLGTDYEIIPNVFGVNVEARFLDETAGAFSVSYKF